MKKLIVLMLVLVMVLAACASSAPPTDQTPSATPSTDQTPPAGDAGKTGDDPIKIAFISNMYNHPNPMMYHRMITEVAEREGAIVDNYDPMLDVQKQNDMIIQAVTLGYDVIVTNPITAESALPAYKIAHEAGVPIVECVVISSGETADYVTSQVTGNFFEVGRMCAVAVEELFPDGANMVAFQGNLGTTAQIEYDRGFDSQLEGKPEYVMLSRQSANWMRDQAMTLMEDYLTTFPDPQIDVLWSQEDTMFYGAWEAMVSAGRTNIKSVALNSPEAAFESVRRGELTRLVSLRLDKMATLAGEVAIKVARGEPVEKIYYQETFIITKEDIDAGKYDDDWPVY